MLSRRRAGFALAVAISPLAMLVACSSAPPEQQLLTQFFRAARTRDNETLARMSAVRFTPANKVKSPISRSRASARSGARRSTTRR